MGAVNKAWTRRPAWPRLFISRDSEISFTEIQKFQNSDYAAFSASVSWTKTPLFTV